MPRISWKLSAVASLAIAFWTIPAIQCQSLGDIARANREKQKTDAPSVTPPKVITNADLPKNSNQEDDDTVAPSETSGSKPADHRSAQQAMNERRAAEQWKRQILGQKRKVANLQARVDQINGSIQAENGSVQYEGPNGRSQARQMQQVAQIQLQLDEQKRTLAEMQEFARHAGMHTTVYDP